MAEQFCEFGWLPQSQCAHCRRARRGAPAWVVVAQHGTNAAIAMGADWVLGEIPTDDQVRRRYLLDPEYHARVYLWRQLLAQAFPPEHDWDQLAGSAAVLGYGPWIESQFYGNCASCGGKWTPGEQIRYCEDEAGWVCSGCGSGDPE